MFVTGSATVPRRMASFGSSGTCVQTAFDLAYQARDLSAFVAYIADDDARARHVDGNPIISLEEAAGWDDLGVFIPIHDPSDRRTVFSRVYAAGLPILGAAGLPHLVHPSARLGEGVIVQSSTRVGPAADLGRGTIVFSDLVAHDVSVGEFSTLAAHSVILGHVDIGDEVFVGARAVIKNGTAKRPIVIGDGAVIGVGAVVDRDVAPGEVVVSPRAVSIAEWQAMRSAAKRVRRDVP